MIFNIHRGQMRLRGGRMAYVPKSPRKCLVMQNIDSGIRTDKTEYSADKLGNIVVVDHRHIETMVALGYPIYNGDGQRYPPPMDDLLFPNIHPDSEYWKRLSQALGKEMKRG